MSHTIPCMVVIPWEQKREGWTLYRWAFDIPGIKYIVPRWVRGPDRHEIERAELFVHWLPIRGLCVAWASDKPPTLEELSRFVPEWWGE